MIRSLTPWLQKYWYLLTILCIVGITAFLRFYQLGVVPHGMTWDEAAIGYNGYAVITTRRDEWLTRLPLSFRSFGDYKAPLAIYLTGIATVLFGLELWVVRLPFALAGVFAVLGAILLGRELFVGSKYQKLASLVLGVLLAVSPWHMYFSRTGFESGLAVTATIWAIYLWIVAWKRKQLSVLLLMASVFLLTATLYTYHSTKITAPLIGVFLAFWYRKQLIENFWKALGVASMGVLLTVPLLYDLFFRNGLERAGVTVFAQGYSLSEAVLISIRQFFVHLSPSFLLFGETTSLRHSDGVHGVLYPTTLFLLICGMLLVFWQVAKKKLLPSYVKMPFLLGIFLIVTGIIPAAVALEVPHANIALTALIGFLLVATVGIHELLRFSEEHTVTKAITDSKNKKTIYFEWIVGTWILLHALFAVDYLGYYFTQYNTTNADAFMDGYLETFKYILPFERGTEGRSEVSQIFFTSEYGQPYIYALFARKSSPYAYHGGTLVKYLFQESFVEGDLLRENALIIASPKDVMPFEKAEKVILGSDGQPRFYIFDTRTVK